MDVASLIIIFTIVTSLIYVGFFVKNIKFLTAWKWVKSHPFELFTALFALTIGLIITKQPIGNLVFLGVAWAALTAILKKYERHYTTILSLVFYALTLCSYYIADSQQHISVVWTSSIMAWFFNFILVIGSASTSKFRWLQFMVIIAISCIAFYIPITYTAYYLIEGVQMQEGQINAILQTNIAESLSYIKMKGTWSHLLILVCFLILLISIALIQSKKQQKLPKTTFFSLALLVIILAYANTFNHIPTQKLFSDTYIKFAKEFEKFSKELAKRKNIENTHIRASKEGRGETYVIVIGESHNKNHMGLYGYFRETTPKLDALYSDSIFMAFQQVYANHVHTVPVLTRALTEVSKAHPQPYYEAISLFDVQKAAGFETYWLSNQIAYGEWDNAISVLAELADHRINFNHSLGMDISTQSYDEVVIPKLHEILSTPSSKNKVIYIHLMGNHGEYSDRYPKSYRKYENKIEAKYTGAYNFWDDNFNRYDNSVLYNDFVLSQIMEEVMQLDAPAAMLYFADHSEAIRYNKGHDMGNYKYSMSETPMLVYCTPKYKDRYPQIYATLKQHTNQVFTNDYIFELVNGITGIDSDYGTEHKTLTSPSYDINPHAITLLHNELSFYKEDNKGYFQPLNIQRLNQLYNSPFVIPHRVNTIGKLHEVQFNKVKGIEVDVLFRTTKDSNYFEIGHDEGSATQMSLNEYLSHIDFKNTKKIWLDIKHVNDLHVTALLDQLNYLNQKYPIKETAIVETSITGNNLHIISDAGYHTSYYIPTHFNSLPPNKQQLESQKIIQQIKNQNLKAVSFDHTLYPFINTYITPKTNNIVYHTWNISLGFFQSTVTEQLKQSNLVKDPRLKTILIKYKSDFEI